LIDENEEAEETGEAAVVVNVETDEGCSSSSSSSSSLDSSKNVEFSDQDKMDVRRMLMTNFRTMFQQGQAMSDNPFNSRGGPGIRAAEAALGTEFNTMITKFSLPNFSQYRHVLFDVNQVHGLWASFLSKCFGLGTSDGEFMACSPDRAVEEFNDIYEKSIQYLNQCGSPKCVDKLEKALKH
jgi:hypothetical protein